MSDFLEAALGLFNLAKAKAANKPTLDAEHQGLVMKAPSYQDYVTNRFAGGYRDSIDEPMFNQLRQPQPAPPAGLQRALPTAAPAPVPGPSSGITPYRNPTPTIGTRG